MSIWNKVLAWLVGIAALAFLCLAAFSLKIHGHWQSAAQKLEEKIATVEADNLKLAEGDVKDAEPAQMSIRQLRVKLANLLVGRRRVWTNCDPTGKIKVNRENGSADITLTIEQPDPPGIADKTVLYAFQQAEVQKRGRYMGEFRVTKSAGKDVTIEPTSALTTREMDRLEAASGAGPWVLYDLLPRDSHEVFAGVSDADLRAMLPPETAREYVKDGKPASKDDPAERVKDGKYVRELRDYSYLFGADAESRAILAEQLAGGVRDKQLLDDALALARKQEQAGSDDVAKAKQDLATRTRERDAVVKIEKEVVATLAAVQEAIEKFIKDNQAKAGRIAEQQWRATQRIDERTRAMAQSGTGRR